MNETTSVGAPASTAPDTQSNTPDAAAWQAAVDQAMSTGMVVLGQMMMQMVGDTKRQIDEQQAES